jgi:anaerobic selenocysteine-containing dehydrogenase
MPRLAVCLDGKPMNELTSPITQVIASGPNYTNTQFTESYGPIPAVVTINPADAARLKITGNSQVKLANDLGCVEVDVEISDAVPGGVLWMPRLAVCLDGKPMNELTSPITQVIASGPTFNSTLVKLIV